MSREVLQVKSITGPTTRFAMVGDEATIGRAQENDLVLSDQTVSRRHARLRVAGDALTIEDLGSRAGTRVNGERVSGTVTLALGDHIVLGLSEMVVSGIPVSEPDSDSRSAADDPNAVSKSVPGFDTFRRAPRSTGDG